MLSLLGNKTQMEVAGLVGAADSLEVVSYEANRLRCYLRDSFGKNCNDEIVL